MSITPNIKSKLNTSYHQQRLLAREFDEENSRDMPFRYVFVLTNLCNLRCSFCFQEKKFIKGSLTLNEWQHIANQLPLNSHITLTGGEPLLFKGFKELVTSLREDISFNIITNGLLLEREMADFLIKQPGLKVISCSIDDVGNKSRDFTDEMWDKLVKNLTYVSEIKQKINPNIVLDIKSVVHGGNVDQINPLANFSTSTLNADTHVFMFLKGNPMQHADIEFDYQKAWVDNKGFQNYKIPEVLKELGILRKNLKKSQYNSTKFFLHPKYVDLYSEQDFDALINLLDQPYHDSKEYLSCRSPWESVHINNDGKVFPCLSFSIGNLKNETLKDVVNSQEMQKFKSDLDKCGTLPACKQCGYLVPKSLKVV